MKLISAKGAGRTITTLGYTTKPPVTLPPPTHCVAQRGPGYFACADNTCLPTRLRCDGVTDCSKGEDEQGCGKLRATFSISVVNFQPSCYLGYLICMIVATVPQRLTDNVCHHNRATRAKILCICSLHKKLFKISNSALCNSAACI